jgi:hypothetical protein
MPPNKALQPTSPKRWSPIRWYAIGSVVLALAASVVEIGRVGGCHRLNIIVPEGFTGTVSLVKDNAAGLDLAASGYTVTVPATGELAVRYTDDTCRCYCVKITSASGESSAPGAPEAQR